MLRLWKSPSPRCAHFEWWWRQQQWGRRRCSVGNWSIDDQCVLQFKMVLQKYISPKLRNNFGCLYVFAPLSSLFSRISSLIIILCWHWVMYVGQWLNHRYAWMYWFLMNLCHFMKLEWCLPLYIRRIERMCCAYRQLSNETYTVLARIKKSKEDKFCELITLLVCRSYLRNVSNMSNWSPNAPWR